MAIEQEPPHQLDLGLVPPVVLTDTQRAGILREAGFAKPHAHTAMLDPDAHLARQLPIQPAEVVAHYDIVARRLLTGL